MEATLMASSSTSSPFHSLFNKALFQPQKLPTCSFFLSFSSQKKRAFVITASVKKKRMSKEEKREFLIRPDESTGVFPEAILLKRKVVKEDGRVLPEFQDAEEEKLYELLTLQRESALNIETMRHYEMVYLIHEDKVDEVESVTSKVQDFIREKKGRIYRFIDWGMRRLAYKIKKARNANYFLMNFELDTKCINEVKNMLDQDERIIRHLVIKRDEAETKDCPPPPEIHTLMGGMAVDDDDDEDEEDIDDDFEEEEEDFEDDFEEGDDEDWDDEIDMEMEGDEGNIIVVGDNEDDTIDQERNAGLKREEIAR